MTFRIFALFSCIALVVPAATRSALARDGANPDFDFLIGTWHTHISARRSGKWVTIDGTVTNRKVWNGAADVEEIEAPASGFEGMTLRLYDPNARQWNLYWASSDDGTVDAPSVGAFENGRGTFYSHELIDGVATYVRQVYYGATPTAYEFEQSFSHDAGKTWQPNFKASLTRAQPGTVATYPDVAESAQQHGFDWQFGWWKIRMRRLMHPLTTQAAWIDLTGTVDVMKLWNGRANLAEVDLTGPDGPLDIIGLRLYLPKSHQWTLAFANSASGQLSAPMYGTFNGGHAAFYDQETIGGKTVWDRFEFFSDAPNHATDKEAVSADGGKTWVQTFYNVHTREVASKPNV